MKGRSQFLNPATGTYTKREADSGRFMDNKADSKPFKGVRREKWSHGFVARDGDEADRAWMARQGRRRVPHSLEVA